MINDIRFGWLAGIIDGEGSINSTGLRMGVNGLFRIPSPQLTVQSTSVAMIQEVEVILRAFGIVYKFDGPRWLTKSTKPAYRVTVGRKTDLLCLLLIVSPYLVVKRKQADLTIGWLERWDDCQGRGKVTPSNRDRKSFICQLSRFNKAA